MIMMLWVYTAIKIIIIKILIIIENENGLFRSSVSVLDFFCLAYILSLQTHKCRMEKKMDEMVRFLCVCTFD